MMSVIGINVTFCVLILLVLRASSGQDCDSKETCDQCIQELNCFWCTSPEFGISHCLNRNESISCNPNYAENPALVLNILEEESLSESKQISPQKVQLKLRKNEKIEIKFQYRQSANYPVDLYYLMDLSHSMEPSKEKLAKLGGKLADEMKRKTNDFRIGFGSFVDKLVLPYVNTDPEALKSPCPGCAPPHSFINHLSLMQDASLFSKRVNETMMSGNLDSPEGGLDAVMQAMVCKKEIGWRPNARHLLVMSTDEVSHIAGDGKLGGVIEPNDATCHMVDNSYSQSLTYDYPSVSQLNYVARKNNINLIFAIVLTEGGDLTGLKGHYQQMSNMIENSKAGTLGGNSDNVVKFISDIYDQIRSSVRIMPDAKKDVIVNITSTCTDFIAGSCSNVKPGQTVNFSATIEPLSCHSDAKLNRKTITIKPEGLEDSLEIDLEVLCDCACAADKEVAHSECNEHGDLECGVCRCQEGRFGANCQCNKTTEIKNEDPSQCVKPGGKNEKCSGRGKCICGKCVCESDQITGKYCECDNYSCLQKCSGHGTCECGKCKCDNGWTGPACECSTDQSQCRARDAKVLCSGHGDCICGQCECSADGGERYSGKYCEDCTSCPPQRCDELKPCVECQAYNSGIYANSTACSENCTIFNTTLVEVLDDSNGLDTKKCRLIVENDCAIVFEYSYDDEDVLIVTAERKKACPEPPPLVAVISGVIGSVLLIGIVTLIVWKIVTTVHDKNEYARFLRERDETKWAAGDNPLYKPGTSHFNNPAYRRSSKRISMAIAAKRAELESNKTEIN